MKSNIEDLLNSGIKQLVPYEPGKPIEDVKKDPEEFLNKMREYRKKRLKNNTSLESILLKLFFLCALGYACHL